MAGKTNEEALTVIVDVAKDVADIAEAGMPFVGSIIRGMSVVEQKVRDRRLNMLFAAAIDMDSNLKPSNADVTEAVRQFAESDEDVLAIVRRALAEDDESKVWLYGAMLRAFALGEVPTRDERLRMLRFASTVVGDDLHMLTSLASNIVAMRNGENWRQPATVGTRHPLMQALMLCGLGNPQWREDVQLAPQKDEPLYRLCRIADVAARSRNKLSSTFNR